MTTTTIHCNAVDDDVTIIIYKNWTTKCSGYTKYVENVNPETVEMLKKKAQQMRITLRCKGPKDCRVTDYMNILIGQEKTTNIKNLE